MRKTHLLAVAAISWCACKTTPPAKPPEQAPPTVDVRSIVGTRFVAVSHRTGALRDALIRGRGLGGREGRTRPGPPLAVCISREEVWLGYPVSEEQEVSAPWRMEALPAMRVAVFAMTGFAENEEMGRAAAVAKVLAAGHEQAGPVIQVFLDDPMAVSEEEYRSEIWVPIRTE